MEFLDTFDESQRQAFLDAAEVMFLDRGDYLLRRGGPGGDVFMVKQGTLEVVDKAYIIDHGNVIGTGSPAEIVRNELVRRSYLGNTFAGDEFDD